MYRFFASGKHLNFYSINSSISRLHLEKEDINSKNWPLENITAIPVDIYKNQTLFTENNKGLTNN